MGSGSAPADRAAIGKRAELAVVDYLRGAGWSIVGTNLRIGRLELDIVARSGSIIAVVEVRTRSASAWTTGLGSVDGAKRMRVRRAGERLWRRRYKNDTTVDRLRFDVASVAFTEHGPVVEYVPAAF